VTIREPAWRVTARELEVTSEEERGEGERVASYLVSPFGGRMNRVLVAGTLTPAEPVGRDDPPTFWRARLTDPTGSVGVTAGSFQPRAMAQMRSVTSPRPALVVGKLHLFRGRDGTAQVSVRAEVARSVPEVDERTALAEIGRQTLDRLDLVERLERVPGTPEEEVRASGTPVSWIRAARESIRRYPQVDRAAFRASLKGLVRRVAGDLGPGPVRPSVPPTVTVTPTPPPRPPARPPSEEERSDEGTFLDLVDELAEGSVDGYADLRELLQRIAARGVGSGRAEAVLNRLEEEGTIEEPIVGKLRRS
jgi:RPA family protein